MNSIYFGELKENIDPTTGYIAKAFHSDPFEHSREPLRDITKKKARKHCTSGLLLQRQHNDGLSIRALR